MWCVYIRTCVLIRFHLCRNCHLDLGCHPANPYAFFAKTDGTKYIHVHITHSHMSRCENHLHILSLLLEYARKPGGGSIKKIGTGPSPKNFGGKSKQEEDRYAVRKERRFRIGQSNVSIWNTPLI